MLHTENFFLFVFLSLASPVSWCQGIQEKILQPFLPQSPKSASSSMGSVRGVLAPERVPGLAAEVWGLFWVQWGERRSRKGHLAVLAAPHSSQISFLPLLSHVICFTALQFWMEKEQNLW